MKLGGKRRTGAGPNGTGRALYDAIKEELAELELGQQMEIGAALTEGRDWDELEGWQQELFKNVWDYLP